ncbi:MAG: GYD domain-containing protein, partial [Acidimicrobiia bacterium]
MPYYLVQTGYTPEAWATMIKNPQDRIAAVRPAVESVGGTIDEGFLSFGEYDLVAFV